MYIDVSLCSESYGLEFFKIKLQSSICIIIYFYKVVVFLNKKHLGYKKCEANQRFRSNTANRQASPKDLILAEAKKLF